MSRREELARMIENLEREAYAKGWRDCAAKLAETASRLAPDAMAVVEFEAPKPAAPKQDAPDAANGSHPLRGRIRANSAAAHVLRVLEKRPGLTVPELVQEIAATGAPTNDPAIRTATKRLRRDERIQQRDGRFYLAESEAAGAASQASPAASSL